MAFEYTDLNTIHDPADGTTPPASWGDQVRDNLERAVKPYCARVRRTAVFSTANAASVAIPWSVKDYDTSPSGNLWVPGSPDRFTVPIEGVWRATFNAQYAVNVTGFRLFFWQWTVAGAPVIRGIVSNLSNPNFLSCANVTTEWRAPAGATLQAFVYQNSGAALDIVMDYEVFATISLVSR